MVSRVVESSAAWESFQQLVRERTRQLIEQYPVEQSAAGPTAGADPDSPTVRYAALYAALIDSSLTVQDAARLLGVDPSRIRQRLADRTLYGLKSRGQWRLPRFQFEGGRPLPGAEVVLPAIPTDIDLVAVFNFFTHPDPDMEVGDDSVSPRDWLLTGNDPAIVATLVADLI
jgi:excisionase family DNA binding protein